MLLSEKVSNFLYGFLIGVFIIIGILCVIGPIILIAVTHNFAWLWLYCIVLPIGCGLIYINN